MLTTWNGLVRCSAMAWRIPSAMPWEVTAFSPCDTSASAVSKTRTSMTWAPGATPSGPEMRLPTMVPWPESSTRDSPGSTSDAPL